MKQNRTIITDSHMGDQPYRMGVYCGTHGFPCDPFGYLTGADSIVHYILGWQDAKGEQTEQTKTLLAQYDSPEIDKSYTRLEWQKRWHDPETDWFYVLPDMVRVGLLDARKPYDQEMQYMADHPGRVISTPACSFRFMPQEEPAL